MSIITLEAAKAPAKKDIPDEIKSFILSALSKADKIRLTLLKEMKREWNFTYTTEGDISLVTSCEFKDEDKVHPLGRLRGLQPILKALKFKDDLNGPGYNKSEGEFNYMAYDTEQDYWWSIRTKDYGIRVIFRPYNDKGPSFRIRMGPNLTNDQKDALFGKKRNYQNSQKIEDFANEHLHKYMIKG